MSVAAESIKPDTPAPEFFSTEIAAARRFYLDLKPPPSRPLCVVSGGVEQCARAYEIHRTTFPFYSIEYVVRGQGNLTLNGKKHALRPGLLFSYGPGISQDIVRNPADPLVKYFIDFSGSQAKALLRSCGLAAGSTLQVYPANAPQPLFDELIRAGSTAKRGSAGLCVKLLECLTLRIAGARTPVKAAETAAFATYTQCREHIERHFLRLRTLEQLAAERHINQAYLCRLFRRYDHESPYQLLLRLKMNHAAERLQESETLVKQVAEEAGFADPFHFSRVFATVFGLSPATFRKLR